MLSPSGGALAKMLPFFKLGVGGPVAGGHQYVSWVHLDDVVGAMLCAIDDRDASGPINVTAPNPVTNAQLSTVLGRVLHRPAVLPVPGSHSGCCTGRWRRSSPPGSGSVPPSCSSSVTGSRTRSWRRRSGTCCAARDRDRRMSGSLLWLRRDLRLHDHPALTAAATAERMTPVFCLDQRLLSGRHASGPRTQFMLECLAELGKSLAIAAATCSSSAATPRPSCGRSPSGSAPSELHLTADVGPFARRRQQEVRRAMDEAAVSVDVHPGLFCVDALREIRTGAGDPYTVFTPFHRNWVWQPRRAVLPAPVKLPPPGTDRGFGRLPSLATLGLEQDLAAPMRGGEGEGRRALARFLAGPVSGYPTDTTG